MKKVLMIVIGIALYELGYKHGHDDMHIAMLQSLLDEDVTIDYGTKDTADES